jgi:hypothetical protein
MALVSWDLADDTAPYSTARRTVLIGPWLSVSVLPQID